MQMAKAANADNTPASCTTTFSIKKYLLHWKRFSSIEPSYFLNMGLTGPNNHMTAGCPEENHEKANQFRQLQLYQRLSPYIGSLAIIDS